MSECIFCKIISGEIPSVKIWEDEEFFAFLDINPISPGHTLLIPKKHTDYLFDIEEPEYSELFKRAKKISKSLKEALESKRIGVVVEGLLVPHAHIHLIPINEPGQLEHGNSKKMDPEELAKIAEKIRSRLN